MLSTKTQSRLHATKAWICSALLLAVSPQLVHAERSLKNNGFITAALSQVDSEVPFMGGISDEINFSRGSLIGLQTTFQPSDDPIEFVVQLLALGKNNWEVDAEWAYVGYKPSDSLELKMGSIRVPFFVVSEYLHVGVAYPWVRPPEEVHFVPFTSIDGASGKFKSTLGNLEFAFLLYAGEKKDVTSTLAGVEISVDRFESRGAVVNLGNDSTQLRVGYHEIINFDLDLASAFSVFASDPNVFAQITAAGLPIPTDFSDMDFVTVGINYNKNQILLMGEWTNIGTEEGSALVDSQTSYLTVGYQLGNFTPHLTYSAYDTKEPAILNLSQYTVMAGLKINLNPAVVFKVDVGQSKLDDAPLNTGFYDVLPFNAVLDDEVLIFNSAINMVF